MTFPRLRLLLCALALAAPAGAVAQDVLPDPPSLPRTVPRPDWRTRVGQVDRLLRIGSLGRAATMLEELASSGAPRVQLLPRWIRLAELREDHEQVVELCREGLASRPRARRYRQSLAAALMSLGRLDEARREVADLIAAAPNRTSAVGAAMQLWQAQGRPEEALALCDSLRRAHDSDDLLRRPRAACLLDLDRVEEAVAEIVAEMAVNPLNLPLVRQELLPRLESPAARRRAAAALADDDLPSAATAAAALLRADLLLSDGEVAEAVAAVAPLAGSARDVGTLLQTAATLAREVPLREDRAERRALTDWLLAVLPRVADSPRISGTRRAQVLDLLAATAEQALADGLLDDDPRRAEARLERILDRVRDENPGSSHLYAAQVLLARHTREELHEPARAARRLERLLTDLDLPLRGVALCRLELGVSRLAAGDTAVARRVLTRLARDSRHVEAAGPAHYHLARLDLAQGHWEEARDRLSAVALDDPAADHANDALDLALLLAEELQRPGGGPALLETYAPVVLWDLRREPRRRREALRAFLAATSAEPAATRESALVGRARLELAGLLADADEPDEAAALCAAVVADRPEGQHAPRALLARGRYLAAAGRDGDARAAWERLLLQYPASLEAEDARLLLKEPS